MDHFQKGKAVGINEAFNTFCQSLTLLHAISLWLLPIRNKSAECVAATLFDEVISRVSVPSTILTDQGTEFMADVVECLLHRLGISHLRTLAYHLETDAKCERVHFSVHNIITKLIDAKHSRWPDLLGTVAPVSYTHLTLPTNREV